MATSLKINKIISQVRQLNKSDQLTLLQRLVPLLKRIVAAKDTSVRLTSICGVGSEIWKSAGEIDNYIEEERQW